MMSIDPLDVMLREQDQQEYFDHDELNKVKVPFVDSFPEHGEQQQIHEEDADNGMISPKKHDVICGKDKFAPTHVGNKKFRYLISSHAKEYQTSESRDEKMRISQRVGDTIRSIGGRFLKLDPDTNKWSEVSDEYTREKISHALRSAKDPNQPKIRKKRRVILKEPTEEENQLLLEHFLEQQRIFQNLVQEYEEKEEELGNARKRKVNAL